MCTVTHVESCSQYLCFYILCCVTIICFVSFAFRYVLITLFMHFIIRFMFVSLFCMYCFIFCVFCVSVFCVLFLLMYSTVSFLFVYKFTDHCHRVGTQLQLINFMSYIISIRTIEAAVFSDIRTILTD
jgi:hypothetical protein